MSWYNAFEIFRKRHGSNNYPSEAIPDMLTLSSENKSSRVRCMSIIFQHNVSHLVGSGGCFVRACCPDVHVCTALAVGSLALSSVYPADVHVCSKGFAYVTTIKLTIKVLGGHHDTP